MSMNRLWLAVCLQERQMATLVQQLNAIRNNQVTKRREQQVGAGSCETIRNMK